MLMNDCKKKEKKKDKRLAQLSTINNMKTKLKKILNQNSNKKQSFYFFSFLPWRKKKVTI
jgi:hypothetical protein